MAIPLGALSRAPEQPPASWWDPEADRGPAETLGREFRDVSAIAAAAIGQPWALLRNDALGRVFFAAERQQVAVENMNAAEAMAEEAYDRRIAAIRDATGVALENPLRGGYFQEAKRQVREEFLAAGRQTIDEPGIPARQARLFEERLAELEEARPDAAAAIRAGTPPAADAPALATEADRGLREALAAPGVSSVGGMAAQLAGGIAGSFRDPVQVMSLFLGGGPGTAATVIGRVGQVAAREGLINAGVAAVAQPQVQAWRRQAGLEAGIEPALANVGMAFLFGSAIGGGLQGVRELSAPSRASVERVMAGAPEPGDFAAAARALGADPGADMLAAVRTGERAMDADRAAWAERPPGAPDDLAGEAMAAALRRAEDPAAHPPAPLAPVLRAGTTDEAAASAMDAAGAGDGSVLAGVAMLRADAALTESALASASPELRLAGRLATLSDEAFDMLREGADPRLGAVVAELVPQPADHADVLARLRAARPADIDDARLITGEEIEALARRRSLAETERLLATRQRNGEPAVAAERAEVMEARSSPEAAQPPAEAPAVAVRDASAKKTSMLDRVAIARDDGTVAMMTRQEAADHLARAGERQTFLADLTKSCR